MAQLLGNVAVGSTVYLNENGSPQPYLVVHQGLPSSLYDESCNGTWLLRQNIILNNSWSLSVNAYASSSVAVLLQNYVSYDPLFSEDIISVIKTVKIPYYVGGGFNEIRSGANGYPCKLFLLGGYEVGWTTSDNSHFPVDGAKLSYFESGTGSSANNKRIAKLNGSAASWWLRSPYTAYSNYVWGVGFDGADSGYAYWYANDSSGVRPAMVMPTNLIVDDFNNITANQIPTISSLTAPSIAMQGQSIPISWTPVSASGFDVTYQLQRNVNNGGWQNVGSPISQTSYTDTAQSGWTEVQYQVAAVVEGFTGTYTQSSIIPVSDPFVLVISGSDGNLGTLTSNVPYTVSSNTGNPISLTRTVNGAQVVTLTVESGFAYSIPIADLPTGTGTIQITASVDNSGGTVTQTRTWTYYKTPINIPSTGGIAQLTQNGQNIWPITVPDAVEAPAYLGGNLNAALNKLGQAALYTKIGTPKYNQVTVDLSKVKVGDEVLLPYNDVMVPHIVVQIGNPDASLYDASCDGVWLLRKDCVAQGQWNSTNVNTLAGSTIMSTMEGYVANYGSEVQSAIKTVKIPYCIGGGNTTINTLTNGLECQMFPLSGYEVGWTNNIDQYLPIDGTVLLYFKDTSVVDTKRIANYNSKTSDWWLRSPYVDSVNTKAWYVISNGDAGWFGASESLGIRPCFIMSTTFNQTYYVDAGNGIHPSQEYTQGGSITDVFGYDVPICQYETGSYVGTGTSGRDNPNTLTFSFEPKIVFIADADDTTSSEFSYQSFPLINGSNLSLIVTTANSPSFGRLDINWNNNSINYYGGTPRTQLNHSGIKYNYIAIG